MDASATVWCPSATSIAFLRKLSPNLISNIIWQVICWSPIGRSSLSPSNALKAGRIFLTSCEMVSHHRVSPLSLSIFTASFTVFGIRIPYLCVFCQYLLAVLDIIQSRFFNTCLVHQYNEGSSEILLWTDYSASWIGYDSFTSLIWFHLTYGWMHPLPWSPSHWLYDQSYCRIKQNAARLDPLEQ